jgi:hypothetical protein
MSNEKIGINMKATLRLEKYPIGTTQEEIDKGLVKPEEIIISEEDILNKNIINNLFGGK